MTTPARIPDWFDSLWETHSHRLPFFLRSDTGKDLVRKLAGDVIQEFAKQATTPKGIQSLIAFSRITAILKGVQGVCDSPDPSPEEVAAAVERLVQRVRP
jgi:hypothetical protein